MNYAETEKELYSRMWSTGYRRSQCAVPLIDLITKHADVKDKLFEIGCGECTTMKGLLSKGYNVVGSDIAAVRPGVIECPAWDIPFKDNEFDVTYSTDVLEHLPTEMVDKAIDEIFRITKIKSVHVIATWGDMKDGEILHKSVFPIQWWIDKFNKANIKGIELVILDRDGFL